MAAKRLLMPAGPPAARVKTVRPVRHWLLLVHQLPARPSNLRVRTWRRLQQIGAIAVKQAVYVLPDTPAAREDFEWLKAEIEAARGHASVFAATSIDAWADDALVDEFRRSRQDAYDALARDAETMVKRLTSGRGKAAGDHRARRPLQQLRDRLAVIERIDFFASAGRDRVLTALRRIDEHRSGRRDSDGPFPPPRTYSGRLWVTRPRPGIDRMACAWLIRRFIDAAARFGFVADRESAPDQAVPFDMFGVEFTHRGNQCTFEMLSETFGLADPALLRIAAIVHDLDLKDDRFGAAEAPAIGAIVEGLRLAHADDHELLNQGLAVFEALYRAFSRAEQPGGPRAVATRRRRPRRAAGRSQQR